MLLQTRFQAAGIRFETRHRNFLLILSNSFANKHDYPVPCMDNESPRRTIVASSMTSQTVVKASETHCCISRRPSCFGSGRLPKGRASLHRRPQGDTAATRGSLGRPAVVLYKAPYHSGDFFWKLPAQMSPVGAPHRQAATDFAEGEPARLQSSKRRHQNSTSSAKSTPVTSESPSKEIAPAWSWISSACSSAALLSRSTMRREKTCGGRRQAGHEHPQFARNTGPIATWCTRAPHCH